MAVKIVQGSDKVFLIKHIVKSTQLPYDFTDLKAAEVKFKKTDGSTQTLNLSSGISIYGHAKLGILKVTISDAISALIKEGLTQSFESKTDVGPGSAGDPGNTVDVQIFQGQLNVYKPSL